MTREEAIKQLKDNRALCINSETEPFAIAYDLAIKALEQEPRWIPVSEGLPKVQDEYLVTWVTETGERFLQMLEFDVVDGEWILEEYMKNYRGVKIIAWKLLPEPYKAESEE